MVQWPHRYCTSLVCFYQLQTVAFVIQTFKILVSLFFPLILPSFCFFFLFAHSLPMNLTGCKRFDKKKYSNLTVYRDSEFFRSF